MVSMLSGCAPADTSSNDATPESAESNCPAEKEPVEDTSSNDGAIAKIGLGHITSIGKSKDAEGENGPVGQVDLWQM